MHFTQMMHAFILRTQITNDVYVLFACKKTPNIEGVPTRQSRTVSINNRGRPTKHRLKHKGHYLINHELFPVTSFSLEYIYGNKFLISSFKVGRY